MEHDAAAESQLEPLTGLVFGVQAPPQRGTGLSGESGTMNPLELTELGGAKRPQPALQQPSGANGHTTQPGVGCPDHVVPMLPVQDAGFVIVTMPAELPVSETLALQQQPPDVDLIVANAVLPRREGD